MAFDGGGVVTSPEESFLTLTMTELTTEESTEGLLGSGVSEELVVNTFRMQVDGGNFAGLAGTEVDYSQILGGVAVAECMCDRGG